MSLKNLNEFFDNRMIIDLNNNTAAKSVLNIVSYN